jgi:hypothetical protein
MLPPKIGKQRAREAQTSYRSVLESQLSVSKVCNRRIESNTRKRHCFINMKPERTPADATTIEIHRRERRFITHTRCVALRTRGDVRTVILFLG